MSETTTNIGVHRDIPAGVYHSWRYASNSILNKLAVAPAKAMACMENPEEPGLALQIGTALHCAVLEPSRFADLVRVKPDGRTKDGKAALAAMPEGCVLLPQKEFDRISPMASAVLNHPMARELLGDVQERELSCVWRDQDSGAFCKARMDALTPLAIVDLKTTEDASPEGFAASIWNYHYHRQGAMYMRGAAALGIGRESFVFIAVEKEPPHLVAVYRLDDEIMEAGHDEISGLLATWAKCIGENHWPGYSEEIVTIGVPAWARRRMELAGVL